MSERYCPTGNHFRDLSRFRKSAAGRPARDCMACEEAKAAGRKCRVGGALIEQTEPEGVDIDAIHYKLGAVSR